MNAAFVPVLERLANKAMQQPAYGRS